MARIVLTDVVVSIAGVDLSDHVASVEIAQNFDEVETTAFGDGGRTRVAGLEDSTISLSFHQDFEAANVDATIGPLVGTVVTFGFSPIDAGPSATNPNYSGNCLITEWTPLNGTVGELSTADVTWPVVGQITRDTGA
jgi:hypothetical protein